MQIGYDHPEVDYKYLAEKGIILLKLYVILIILGLLIPQIIPLLAVLTIIGIGIRNLFKWIKEKRKKNEKSKFTGNRRKM